jgi:hypothetical protein
MAKVLGRGVFIYWGGQSISDSRDASRTLDPAPKKTGRLERIGIIK